MDQRIDLAPNCSLTDTSASLHYAFICAVSLPLAMLFAWAGYWPVLLFWMLEMLGLGVALHLSLGRRRCTQTVLISEDRVRLVTRSARGEVTQEFARHWARVRPGAASAYAPGSSLLDHRESRPDLRDRQLSDG